MAGTENLIDDEGREKLKKTVENILEKKTEALVKKVQSDYGADVFGFGSKIRENMHDIWNTVSDKWEEKFKDIAVNIKSTVHIKNSALMSKPLKVGE